MSAFEELGVMPEIIRGVEELDWLYAIDHACASVVHVAILDRNVGYKERRCRPNIL